MKYSLFKITLLFLAVFLVGFLSAGCAKKPLPWSRELDTKALKIFNEGQELFNQKRYREARRRYNKVIKSFSRSRYADNAQFMLGEIQAIKRKFESAVEEYHKVAKDYPASELLPLVAEKEYKIALYFWEKKKKKTAIEIFSKVVEDYPYGELALKAQVKVADYYYSSRKDYAEAIIQYEKLINDFPQHPTLSESVFRLGVSYWQESLMWALDQKNTDLAIEQFDRLIIEFSSSPNFISQAKELRALAIDKKARKEYQTGYFYYWEGAYEAARLYYNNVLKNYPDTKWEREALYDLGRTYYKEKKWLMAQEKFNEVKEEFSDDPKLVTKTNIMLEKCTRKLQLQNQTP